jgi:hypothetical protein
MNKKYERYISYIVDDIKPPYFISMVDNYGLSKKEYPLVLSKLYNQPVTIIGNYVYDQNGNKLYSENITGNWYKYEYDANDNLIYSERSAGYWYKWEYDSNGNVIYYEDSTGDWSKYEYDDNGNEIYSEDSYGNVRDNRR